jgi:outer membrane protein TolC
MRMLMRTLLASAPMIARSAAGTMPTPPKPASPAPDPILQALLREALARNPELAQAQALVDASKAEVPQAGALADPTLSLGLQNDGFNGIQVGKMPTSYYEAMVSQPLPWPGKRRARTDIASLGVKVQDASLDRTRLQLVSDLERAYVGLVLVREQLRLIDQQASYLAQAEGSAKVRYEVGQGNQSDLLRAQLERTRLQQQRLSLQAQEPTLLATINRIRNRPSDTPLDTPVRLESMPLPVEHTEAAWMDRADSESPDLAYAKRSLEQASRRLDLAKLNVRPDFAVTAGYMARGSLDPMWTVGFSIGLPVCAHRKQQKAVAEESWRKQAEGHEVEAVRTLLRQRIRERVAQLASDEASIRIYRQGLLVQSKASFKASLAQYEAGKVPFLTVLESLDGWVADQSGYLQALSQAQAQDIALREFNLGSTPAITGGAMGSPSLGLSSAPSGMAASGGSSSSTSSMSSM